MRDLVVAACQFQCQPFALNALGKVVACLQLQYLLTESKLRVVCELGKVRPFR